MLGKDETVRYLDLAIFQGLPIKKGIKTIVSCSRLERGCSLPNHRLRSRLWQPRTTPYSPTRMSETPLSSALRTSDHDSISSLASYQSEWTASFQSWTSLTRHSPSQRKGRPRCVQREAYPRRNDDCRSVSSSARSSWSQGRHSHHQGGHSHRPLPRPSAQDGRELCRTGEKALLRRGHLPPSHPEICSSSS